MNDLIQFLQQDPEAFGKYAPILMEAANRSPQSLIATHYTLQQKDPAYNIIFTEQMERRQEQ